MSSAKKVGILQGEEVVQMLVSIWLDGFLSGGATALESFAGAPDHVAAKTARHMSGILQADPLAMLGIEREVKERLAGIDTGTKSITVKDEPA